MRGTHGYARRPADRGAKNPDAGGEELSKRNDARQARAKRTGVSSHAPYAPISISIYVCTRTHVCRVLWLRSCVSAMAIDRPSSHTHLSTCHYTSGTSVLCAVTLVKMTVSADARGYITRPIHTTLIMAGIAIESRAFRPWAGFNLLLSHLRPTFARHCAWRRSPS